MGNTISERSKLSENTLKKIKEPPMREPKRIGIIYCANEKHGSHTHPEKSERVLYAQTYLTEKFPNIPIYEMKNYTNDQILNFLSSTHDKVHLSIIKEYFDNINSAYSTGINSYNACLNVCKSLMTMCELIENDTIDCAINIVRPPGHHCCNRSVAGFCLINSAVLVTKRLLKMYNKIPIYDFDLHHGGGTQSETYNNPNIMYVSQHNKNVWKDNFNYGYITERGGRSAPLTNINIPLAGESNDYDYILTGKYAINQMSQFNSEIVVVSAGFDAHINEFNIGTRLNHRMCLTSEFYGRITSLLLDKFDKMFIILEGGYEEEAIAESLTCMIQAMLGKIEFNVNRKKIKKYTNSVLEELQLYYQ